MMREILFRGKRLDNGEWVYGFYCHLPRGRLDRDEHLIQTVKKSGKMGRLHCVDPSTVGQYTGLIDKDRDRIFEGDIVVFSKNQVGYIGTTEIVNGNACVMGKYISPLLDLAAKKYEANIIGNIHDNPEFLNGDEDT